MTHARGVIGIVFATVLLVACGSSSSPGSSGATSSSAPFKLSGTPVKTTRVDLPKSYRFSPAIIEVSAGSTVTWTNHDNFIHSVHLLTGGTLTKNLAIGASAQISFAKPGIYYYECSYHPSLMHGEVIVH